MARQKYAQLMQGLCGGFPDPRMWCESLLDSISRPGHQLPPSVTWAEVSDFKAMCKLMRDRHDVVNEVGTVWEKLYTWAAGGNYNRF
jgi:hypothetical protein